jgi:hypothetical protein
VTIDDEGALKDHSMDESRNIPSHMSQKKTRDYDSKLKSINTSMLTDHQEPIPNVGAQYEYNHQ